jgi:hypothetical protein
MEGWSKVMVLELEEQIDIRGISGLSLADWLWNIKKCIENVRNA